ncbi:MAG: HAMP domain-containing protein [Methylotenera sp.]|nr:HAMP domain-containing protein [Oligoflexia bacterium]
MFSSKAESAPLTSLRTRLVFLFVGIFGVTLILFSFFLYEVFVSNHQKEFDAALYNYTVDVASAVDVSFFGELTLTPNALTESEKVFPFALGEAFLQIYSVQGKPLARSRNLSNNVLKLTDEDRTAVLAQGSNFKTIPAKELARSRIFSKNYRLLTYLINRSGPFDYVVQVAVPMVLLEHEKSNLITFFSFSIPIVLLIAACGGLYVSRKALAPVNAIIEKSKKITATQLSQRVPVPAAKDEIRELALTLNALLDRLEQAFYSQETFIADASHQLKTPLSILRGEIDLMRSKERSAQEMAEFLHSASQEVNYLSRMVEDLLILARVDAGASSLSIQSVRLDETVLEVIARLDRIATQKAVKLSVHFSETQSPMETEGDGDLIRSLVENLIENAVKYSPEQGKVSVTLSEMPEERILLAVEDQGRGIPESSRDKIFDRFYRSENSRDKISGSGLGLAIAKRIVEVHGGKIRVESRPETGVPGSCFKVEFRRRMKA